MSQRSEHTQSNPDLDEIAPNSFIIHNDRVRPILRGEGVVVGHTFELVGPRRGGLLGRLRERGFNPRTLHSRYKRLPHLPGPLPLGETRWREPQKRERYSVFDELSLRWRDLKPEQRDGKIVVGLRVGEPIRRRKSRTGGDYFIVAAGAKNEANLTPLTQTEALLHGYAQATADADIEIEAMRHDDAYLLPLQFVLPEPYTELLKRLGTQTTDGIIIGDLAWPLALRTLHLLHLRPEVGDADLDMHLDDEVWE